MLLSRKYIKLDFSQLQHAFSRLPSINHPRQHHDSYRIQSFSSSRTLILTSFTLDKPKNQSKWHQKEQRRSPPPPRLQQRRHPLRRRKLERRPLPVVTRRSAPRLARRHTARTFTKVGFSFLKSRNFKTFVAFAHRDATRL